MTDLLDLRSLRSWAVLLIVAGILAQASSIFVKREALAHRPFEEDTFFHMAVTRNMAMGKGITIDGKEPTSGAQPGTFVYVLAHWAARFDKWQALRWARLLDVLASIAAAFLLYAIVRRVLRKETVEVVSSYALLTAGLWLSSFQVFRVGLNGYETGFAAVLLLAVTFVYLRVWQDQPAGVRGLWNDALLGFLLGGAVLTRVDHGFLAASAALCFVAMAPEAFLHKIRRVVIWGSIALLITAPWWRFNYQVGASIMPTSGKASAFQMTFHGFWPSVRQCFLRTAESVLGIGTLSFYSPYSWGDNLIWILFLSLFVLGIVICFRGTKPLAQLGFHSVDFRPFAFLLFFALILVLYYTLMHGSWWFMKRYTHPIRTSAYIFSALFVAAASVSASRVCLVRPRWIFWGILAVHLLVTVASTATSFNQTNSNTMMIPARYLAEHCQDGKIGAFQSGTLGYFLDNVVNLDGKNNAHALEAVTKGTVIEYMLSQRLKYVADWPKLIALYCNYQEFLKYYEPIAKVGGHEVYRLRDKPVASPVDDFQPH